MDDGLDLDDLDFDLAALPGRPRKMPAVVSFVRPITQADLVLLATAERAKPENEIKRASDRHHAVARMIASGMDDIQISTATGYTVVRVNQLKQDPTFQELVTFYRGEVNEAFADMAQQIGGFSKDLILELRDRFETNPASFSNSMILEVMTKLMDRSGFGPSSQTNVNVTHGFGERLQIAREREEKSRELKKQADGSYA